MIEWNRFLLKMSGERLAEPPRFVIRNITQEEYFPWWLRHLVDEGEADALDIIHIIEKPRRHEGAFDEYKRKLREGELS